MASESHGQVNKKTPQSERKYLQKIYLINDYYAKYTKNS